MGCCASSPAPYERGQHGNASSRNPIISAQPQSNPAFGRPSTARSNPSQQPQPNQQRQDQAPAVKPNKELRRLVWTSTDKIWTRQTIDRERDDFFFTRVTGRQEVWQTIRTALEVIWAGGDPADDDGGIKTAQEILKAASITLPHSTLDRGVYDVSGGYYALPKYVVCDPTNLAEDPVLEDDGSKGDGVDKSEAASEEEDEAELRRRREEKGKGVADPENEEIQLKARRSDGGSRDLVILAGKKDTVRQLQRKFNDSAGLAPPKRIQLWYMGFLLKEEETLLDQGWHEGDMLQAFVSDMQGQQSYSKGSRPKIKPA